MNIIFQSIRVARLKVLEDNVHGAPEYPSSDQLLDNAVVVSAFLPLPTRHQLNSICHSLDSMSSLYSPRYQSL